MRNKLRLFQISKISFFCIILGVFFCASLFAQTHVSVPLDNQIYYIIEQAEIRGLIGPVSGVRPFTRNVVIGKINEILASDSSRRQLTATERDILNHYLESFSRPAPGLDWQRGGFFSESAFGRNEVPLSLDVSVTAELEGSSGIYLSGSRYAGMELWLGLHLQGDLGRNVSYSFTFEGGLVSSPRRFLGTYWTFYEGFTAGGPWDPNEFVNREINVYSQPLTHFPFSYRRRWDGSVFFFDALTGYDPWPYRLASGYSLPAELTASFFDDRLLLRLGRIRREWGLTSVGSSLSLNRAARPFLAFEAEFNPFPWVVISSMTGALEYDNLYGIKESSMTFQNLFSITMIQFRVRNFLFFEITDAVVYPKRFELGYISPITNNFFNQNTVGDFDNMAITLSLRAQFPGIGSLWFSLFVDEMNLLSEWALDRQMLAMQAGITVPLPFLSFSSLTLSYTKVNPYTYTHTRNFKPWYGDNLMETAYVNNGVSLGHYLPPNSDEFLVRFRTMPTRNVSVNLSYQLIRRGADFGPSAVDGSNLRSELDPHNRDGNPVLRRYFLRDGAYQWNHIIRAGVDWNVPRLPISLFAEAGTVISYFTNIEGPPNRGYPSPFFRVNTFPYTDSFGVILRLGVRIFSSR